MRFATLSVHAAKRAASATVASTSVVPDLCLSSTFKQEDPGVHK